MTYQRWRNVTDSLDKTSPADAAFLAKVQADVQRAVDRGEVETQTIPVGPGMVVIQTRRIPQEPV